MSRKAIKLSLLFVFLSGTASIINFLFYPVMSHSLSLAEFGDVQAGISFIMLAAALFTSLSTLALYTSANKQMQSSKAIVHIEHLVITVSLALAVLTLFFAAPISSSLNLQSSYLVVLLAMVFLLNIPAATWVGSLQGAGQFIASGWIGAISASSKIVFAFIFVLLGWKKGVT